MFSNFAKYRRVVTIIYTQGNCFTATVLRLQQGPPKGTTTSPRGRGRPKKTEEKPEITGEDEDEQEEEEEEEEN